MHFESLNIFLISVLIFQWVLLLDVFNNFGQIYTFLIYWVHLCNQFGILYYFWMDLHKQLGNFNTFGGIYTTSCFYHLWVNLQKQFGTFNASRWTYTTNFLLPVGRLTQLAVLTA